MSSSVCEEPPSLPPPLPPPPLPLTPVSPLPPSPLPPRPLTPSLSLSPAQLYRSDFFPGLGWMMTQQLWSELSPKWPEKYWDDWMREPEQRRDRQGLPLPMSVRSLYYNNYYRACIRPEISRTITFGDKGVSAGQFYKQHLQYIKLNSDPIDFTKVNLSYLTEVCVKHVPVYIPVNYLSPCN